MEGNWVAKYGFELLQSIGIIAGLLFSAYSNWDRVRARKVSSSFLLTQQHHEHWNQLHERRELFRILKPDVDLKGKPVSDQEHLFVKQLILHSSNVHRAVKMKMLKEPRGMQKDIGQFFSLPIPNVVWERVKPFQDKDFVAFIETSRSSR